MSFTSKGLTAKEIGDRVSQVVGPVKESSVRSYLRLNTPQLFTREERGVYALRQDSASAIQCAMPPAQAFKAPISFGRATLHHADCFDWLEQQPANSIHAVITDPPYGLHEYTDEQQAKLREGRGGVWRIPPSFDGHVRSPVPRFTTLNDEQLKQIKIFFYVWARLLLPKLVPGAHV
ncbi:MAG: site-specific DNA-methyltransferase, partial [Chloroflexota bacterium]|nr:site-specific DNA-methyltransferase [Chloroflexota bacterium]